MKTRRFGVLFGLLVAAAVTLTAVSSSSAARPAPSVRSHPTVWVNGSGVQGRLPATASPRVRAMVRNAGRMLQASGDSNICIGGTPDNSVSGTQRCNFNGSAGVCIQKSSNPSVIQICKFSQGPSDPAKTNLAIALQVIIQKTDSIDGQRGQQLIKVRQQNTSKSNLSFVVQIVKQSLGNGANDSDNEVNNQAAAEAKGELLGTLPDFGPVISQVQNSEPLTEGDETAALASPRPPVSQTQNSQQTVRICQGGPNTCLDPAGMSGNNLSSVYQSLRQRERASNASAIDQHQNPDPGTCPVPDTPDPLDPAVPPNPRNMCASVAQNTTGGKNVSGLAELYRQFQSGSNTASLSQEQDPSFADVHGLDHDIQQLSVVTDPNSPKRNTIFTFQLARQVQRAKHATSVDQFQDPRTAKGPGSFQTGTVNDTWFGRQFATQLQTTDGVVTANGQEQRLTYDGVTTGNFDVLQRGTSNGSTAENTCSGNFCNVVVQCDGGGEAGPSECFSPEIDLLRRH
jgi:hypothetical protein